MREVADGVIVGSALVRQLAQVGPRPQADVVHDIGQLTQTLTDALNSPETS